MAIKILAINGSYRRGGIIDQAVEAACAGARAAGAETSTVFLSEKPVEFCLNCRSCTQEAGDKRGACVRNDGMAALLDLAEGADGLIHGEACPLLLLALGRQGSVDTFEKAGEKSRADNFRGHAVAGRPLSERGAARPGGDSRDLRGRFRRNAFYRAGVPGRKTKTFRLGLPPGGKAGKEAGTLVRSPPDFSVPYFSDLKYL